MSTAWRGVNTLSVIHRKKYHITCGLSVVAEELATGEMSGGAMATD
jgi:hypothetical protein